MLYVAISSAYSVVEATETGWRANVQETNSIDFERVAMNLLKI